MYLKLSLNNCVYLFHARLTGQAGVKKTLKFEYLVCVIFK